MQLRINKSWVWLYFNNCIIKFVLNLWKIWLHCGCVDEKFSYTESESQESAKGFVSWQTAPCFEAKETLKKKNKWKTQTLTVSLIWLKRSKQAHTYSHLLLQRPCNFSQELTRAWIFKQETVFCVGLVMQ